MNQHKQAVLDQSKMANRILDLKLQLDDAKRYGTEKSQELVDLETRTTQSIQELKRSLDQAKTDMNSMAAELRNEKMKLEKKHEAALASVTERCKRAEATLEALTESESTRKARKRRRD